MLAHTCHTPAPLHAWSAPAVIIAFAGHLHHPRAPQDGTARWKDWQLQNVRGYVHEGIGVPLQAPHASKWSVVARMCIVLTEAAALSPCPVGRFHLVPKFTTGKLRKNVMHQHRGSNFAQPPRLTDKRFRISSFSS